MPKVDLYNQDGNTVGEIELSDDIFGIEVNEHAVYEAVKNQLANKRQGTHKAKTRGQVRGGGRKPWRQKGTGRARQGSRTAPNWRGGGIVFAKAPRDYSYSIPKKVKRLAIKSALTSKVNDNEIKVLDNLLLENISTKKAQEILNNLGVKKALVVIDEKNDSIYKSFRNIFNVEVAISNQMNTYDLLKYDYLVITEKAVRLAEEVFS